LITNRDDYLEHSSKNYTAEQKQYNNWLTERLLELAEQYNYAFDPEDFNFVAIRDRIRCYYKSYVQTARKRGLELPGKAHIKKFKPNESGDGATSGGGDYNSDDNNDEHYRSSRHHDGKSSTASTPTTSNAEKRRHVAVIPASSKDEEHEQQHDPTTTNHNNKTGGDSKQEQQHPPLEIENDKTDSRGSGRDVHSK
jgi:hypothetical protein